MQDGHHACVAISRGKEAGHHSKRMQDERQAGLVCLTAMGFRRENDGVFDGGHLLWERFSHDNRPQEPARLTSAKEPHHARERRNAAEPQQIIF